MINYQGILFAGICGILFACQQKSSQQDATVQESKQVGQQELTDSIILTLIFHNLEKANNSWILSNYGKFYSRVSADSTQFSDQHWKDLDARQIDYYVEYVEEIKEDSITKYLAVLGGTGMSFHACPGVCAGAVFVREENEWKLETFENDIAVLGESGYPVKDVSITQLEDGICAIILKNSGIWSGENWRYFTVVLYDHGSFKEGFSKPVTYSLDNWPDAEGDLFTVPFAFTSFISFEPGGRQYEDLVMHFQGTIFDKRIKKAVLLDKYVRFKYENRQYTTTDKLPDE